MVADPPAFPRLEAGNPADPPDDLVPEVPGAENRVHDDLEIVRRRGVAMQVDAAGGFEDALRFGEPFGHIGQVGEHSRRAERQPDAFDGVGDLPGAVRQFADALRGGGVPSPGVLESGRLAPPASVVRAASEGESVVALRVERRIEVDQVHLLRPPAGHHFQAVAEMDGVGDDRRNEVHRAGGAAVGRAPGLEAPGVRFPRGVLVHRSDFDPAREPVSGRRRPAMLIPISVTARRV